MQKLLEEIIMSGTCLSVNESWKSISAHEVNNDGCCSVTRLWCCLQDFGDSMNNVSGAVRIGVFIHMERECLVLTSPFIRAQWQYLISYCGVFCRLEVLRKEQICQQDYSNKHCWGLVLSPVPPCFSWAFQENSFETHSSWSWMLNQNDG